MSDVFHRLMGSVDPPMVVVTARSSSGEAVGCLVGFSSQVSIGPQRYAVCVSRTNHTFEPVMAAEHLVVHVLRDDDRAIAERFGEETGDEVDKFAGLEVTNGPGGVPVIVGLDWFGGRVFARYDGGDHVIVVVDPEGGDASRAAEPQFGLRSAVGFVPGHPA